MLVCPNIYLATRMKLWWLWILSLLFTTTSLAPGKWLVCDWCFISTWLWESQNFIIWATVFFLFKKIFVVLFSLTIYIFLLTAVFYWISVLFPVWLLLWWKSLHTLVIRSAVWRCTSIMYECTYFSMKLFCLSGHTFFLFLCFCLKI